MKLENILNFCRHTVGSKGKTICSNIDLDYLRTCMRGKCENGGGSESRSTHIGCKCKMNGWIAESEFESEYYISRIQNLYLEELFTS